MRELWLPALEWFFSERVDKLYRTPSLDKTPKDAKSGEKLSDEAVLAAADFAIFVE